MADSPRFPDPDTNTDDTGVGPDRRSSTGIARWQKVVAIIGLVVLLVIVLMLTGVFGSGHTPGPPAGGH